MIRNRRFTEFIMELMKIRNEEQEEKTLWEFYLHKVFDKTFKEFRDAFSIPDAEFKEEDIKTTIQDSFSMLQNFSPEGSISPMEEGKI